MTLYQIASYFLIYSFLGWCTEVVYQALKRGKIINRGFLNGPVCPVYGFGVIAVFAFTKKVLPSLTSLSESRMTGENRLLDLLVLFLLGVALATAVELIAGWLLDVCFHARWWDYSNVPLNFHGYICLRFSIIWGLAIVFVVRIIQPVMESEKSLHIPEQIGWPLLCVLYLIYLADFIVTVMIVAGMNRRLTELDDIQKKMRIVSDDLSQKLGKNTLETQQKAGERRVQMHLAGMEMKDRSAETREKLYKRKAELEKQLLANPHFGTGRLLKAFPDLVHREHDSVLKTLRERIAEEAAKRRKPKL
ncbi:MAG: hypothetical protein IJI10_07720 [Eubacterium sp.]|nr:hypothetical protein [Eubacterium sp.]